MLSIDDFHKNLNDGASEDSFTKAEEALLRDFLTGMAEIAFEAFNKEDDTNDETNQPSG